MVAERIYCKNENINKNKIWECLSDLLLFLAVNSTYLCMLSEESQWTLITHCDDVFPQLLTLYI